MRKTFFIFVSIFIFSSTKSQTPTRQVVLKTLDGKWELIYKNEQLFPDTALLFQKRIYEINGKKGKEIGYWKNGETTRASIKWDFISSNNKADIVIMFTGGIWVDGQDFIIKNVSNNKITMLSCDKYDECDEVYFIKQPDTK